MEDEEKRVKLKELNDCYKKSCIDRTKRDLNEMINNFIDDDNTDGDYKDKIIDMIVCLLSLK